jgi:hypothetical protein
MREQVASADSFDAIADTDLEKLSTHLREYTQHCAAQRKLDEARKYDEMWRRCRAEIKRRQSERDRRFKEGEREKEVAELEEAYRKMEEEFVSCGDAILTAVSHRTNTQISGETGGTQGSCRRFTVGRWRREGDGAGRFHD